MKFDKGTALIGCAAFALIGLGVMRDGDQLLKPPDRTIANIRESGVMGDLQRQFTDEAVQQSSEDAIARWKRGCEPMVVVGPDGLPTTNLASIRQGDVPVMPNRGGSLQPGTQVCGFSHGSLQIGVIQGDGSIGAVSVTSDRATVAEANAWIASLGQTGQQGVK